MLRNPFKIFLPYRDKIDICLLTRNDAIGSDADCKRATNAKNIASLSQVHGNRAVRLSTASRRLEKADALATDRKDLTLTIRFADCQNFLVFSPEKNIICLIHAGWRGLRSGIIASTFALLKSEWSVDAADVLVGAGPSLCMKCAEFTDPQLEAPELSAYVHGRCIDLNRAAEDQLFSLGVNQENFERINDCTRCHPEKYFTYRGGDREEVTAGRTNVLAVKLL